jgi:DNA repair protein RadA/Sms
LKEAQKLGFTAAIVPKGGKSVSRDGITATEIDALASFVGDVFGAG